MQVSEPGTAVVTPHDFITEKTKKRHLHKVNRDYAAADFIRDRLNENFGVALDDRTKEWRIRNWLQRTRCRLEFRSKTDF